MPRISDISTLKKRARFLAAAASGKKWVAPGLILQAGPSPDKSGVISLCFGLTASSKVGNAVVRNRARRRLRALAQEILPLHAMKGHDYVLIARVGTVTRDYKDLRQDLIGGLKRLKLWQEAVP